MKSKVDLGFVSDKLISMLCALFHIIVLPMMGAGLMGNAKQGDKHCVK